MSKMTELADRMCAESSEFAEAYKKERERLDVAVALMRLRESEGLSQRELAELAHKPQSTIARIENGTLNPSYNVLSDIAHGVGKRLEVSFV
jgi:ribosome-binding protein aMBF1 (putative translation factor)